jgi:hypothetical protein
VPTDAGPSIGGRGRVEPGHGARRMKDGGSCSGGPVPVAPPREQQSQSNSALTGPSANDRSLPEKFGKKQPSSDSEGCSRAITYWRTIVDRVARIDCAVLNRPLSLPTARQDRHTAMRNRECCANTSNGYVP